MKLRRWFFIFIVSLLSFPAHADSRDPLWRFITGGRIRSYPAVGWDGDIYVISDDRFLYCLAPDGTQRWRYYLEDRITDCFAVGFDGMIYIGYKSGELLAVHGYGKKVWQYSVGQGLVFSPAVRSDGAICLASDEGWFFIISHTGILLHKQSLHGIPAAPPALDADNTIYVPLRNEELVALEPWGEIKWRLKIIGTPGALAIGRDGRIYLGTDAGLLYAVDPSIPAVVWSVSLRGGVLPPVVGDNDTIYAITPSGEIAAVSHDGRILWTLPLGESPAAPCVIGGSGTIFAASRSSTLYAINNKGRIEWNIKVKGMLTQLCLSPQEILYAGSSDWAVYAFPGEKPSEAAWPAFQRDIQHSGASRRSTTSLSIEIQYANDLEFVYFQSLFLSGNAALMEKGLEEIQFLADEDRIRRQKPYLLYFLRKIAGFTVIEEERSMKFPLRGFSEIRRKACELYVRLGGLTSFPLLLAILKYDKDWRMKAVAARCLGLLRSDPRGEAVAEMAALVRFGATEPDNTFAREVVTAMKNIAEFRGRLPREGVLALIALSKGRFNGSVKRLARETLAAIASEH